jgi:F-type H+-transporting ATPase subunit beta
VPIKDTIEGFSKIAGGEFDHIPEQAFFNVGGLDMVMENYARLQKESGSK